MKVKDTTLRATPEQRAAAERLFSGTAEKPQPSYARVGSRTLGVAFDHELTQAIDGAASRFEGLQCNREIIGKILVHVGFCTRGPDGIYRRVEVRQVEPTLPVRIRVWRG